jgi:hypothetical protein
MHRERRLMDKQKIADKLLSGRFILTVICGVTFAYLAAKGSLEAAAVTAILGSVFTSYFDRSDRNPPAGGAVA